MAPYGVENTIKRITGKDEARRFLSNLGFVEGSKVTVVNTMGKNLIVKVRDARVALDASMANRVMV